MAFRPNKDIKPPVIPAREAAKGATLARTDDDALKAPPRTDGTTTGKTGEGSSLDVFNTPAASPAAGGAAAAVKGAVEQRLSDAKTGPSEEDHSGTIEASTEISDRLNESLADMLDRAAGDDVLGLGSGAGEQADGTEASRDSGKGGLQRLVDETFRAEETAGGGGFGQMGTPEDLGVTGAIGAKGDLGGGSGTGLDVFNVNLSTLGASGVANDLAVMQGIASGSDPDPGAGPSAESHPGGAARTVNDVAVITGETVIAGAAVGGGIGAAGGAIETGVLIASMVGAPVGATIGVALAGAGGVGYVAGAIVEAQTSEQADRLIEKAVSATEDSKEETEAKAEKARQEAAERRRQREEAEAKKKQEEEAKKKQEEELPDGDKDGAGSESTPTTGQTVDPETMGHPELTPEYMAWRAAARERLGLGHGGSGDIDPADNGEAVAGGPPLTVAEAGLQQKAVREFLVGQPAGPAAGAHGGGSIDSGRLPGDMGNIDFGPDSTGAWTGNTQTESESEALDSLGGSGLTIEDAHRNDDEEDEEEDSDDAS